MSSSSSSRSDTADDDAVLNAPWVQADAGLQAWLPEISARHRHFVHTLETICSLEGSLHDFCFAHGLERFGLQRGVDGTWYREWAPAALGLSLVGDFNGWDERAHPCSRADDGVWEVFVPNRPDGRPALAAGSRFKAAVRIGDGKTSTASSVVLRMPAWARQTVQDVGSGEFSAVVPSSELLRRRWRHPRPPQPSSLHIYEAHVGIASSEPIVAGWAHFRTHVLPRVAAAGYTALLLFGVHEHGYYGSFGYQVTSYFAPSSRFGAPEELQQLVDAAHGYGLLVLFELVHSHASANSAEGLSGLDGSDGQYFLRGAEGRHALWGSRLFDYGSLEVARLLLANVAWLATAYRRMVKVAVLTRPELASTGSLVCI